MSRADVPHQVQGILATLLVLAVAPLSLALFGLGAVGTTATLFQHHAHGGPRILFALSLALGAAMLVPVIRWAWNSPD